MLNIDNQHLLSFMVTEANNAVAVTNPATGELIGHAPISSETELASAIERAHVAQKEWAKIPAKSRAALLHRWHHLILENKDDLARIMTMEQGKPLAEATGEVVYGASFIEWFAEEAKRTYGDS
ncbi:aldehyde dehydrogenase family protein, partial [Vibrio sp. 10N.222.52.B7]|uniref:aldehyde dehydrogenase family protein n=1 Tax=Vibrio sp. 10N.222.52.B7 TaxID=3229629 RepID=UPI00354FBB46